MEEALGRRHGEQVGDLSAATALSAHGHLVGIAAEPVDVLVYPFESLDYILLAEVDAFGPFSSKGAEVDVSEHVEPVVEVDHHYVALLRKGIALVAGQVMRRSAGEASSMAPQEYRTLLSVVDSRSPDIEYKAALLIHLFDHERIVGLRRLEVPAQMFILHGLRSVDLAHAHPFEAVGILGRHEALRLCIGDALECVDGAVEIAFDSAVDGFNLCVFAGGDGTDSLADVLAAMCA